MSNYYLGVDGGGTKTKFLLSDETGHILSSSTQSTCHYLQCGLNGVTTVIKNGLEECCIKTGIEYSQIRNAFVACAGYGDIPEDNKKINEAVKKAFNYIPYTIGNDTDNAIAGSLIGKDGIHVIAGTGSIGILKQNNHYIRCGGWHHLFGGDEGSAYWIACKLIQEFTKQSDNRHTRDELYDYTKNTLSLKSDSDILQKTIIDWNFDRTKIASLSPIVYNLAKQNTASAIKIYNEAAKELSEIYIALKHISQKQHIDASFSGGVFKSGNYIIKPLEELLQKENIYLKKPCFEPDIGSIILAFDNHVQLTDEIINNLNNTKL